MAKITYQDKVNLINTDTPIINKIRGVDMNEIKNRHNENDDRIDAIINRSGYADYADTQYTEGSPFTVLSGTKVNLPNNAGLVYDEQKPTDIVTFYDEINQKITGRDGDGLAVVFEFKVKPLQNASNIRVRTSIDIGGAVGEIYPFAKTLERGVGVEDDFFHAFAGYTRDTWEANGGQVKVQATNSNIEIYDIRYVLTRTHKAR